jgi:NADH dehydrogenase
MNISGFLAWVIWRIVYPSKSGLSHKKVRVFLDLTIDLFFDRDISRLKFVKPFTEKEYNIFD